MFWAPDLVEEPLTEPVTLASANDNFGEQLAPLRGRVSKDVALEF